MTTSTTAIPTCGRVRAQLTGNRLCSRCARRHTRRLFCWKSRVTKQWTFPAKWPRRMANWNQRAEQRNEWHCQNCQECQNRRNFLIYQLASVLSFSILAITRLWQFWQSATQEPINDYIDRIAYHHPFCDW